MTDTPSTRRIALFRGKEIRKTIHNDEWWFSVVDILPLLPIARMPGITGTK